MIVGVLKESCGDERRVSLVPAVLPLVKKAELEVLVQRGAGEAAGLSDAQYEQAGAHLASDRGQLFAAADIILCIHGLHLSCGAGPDNVDLLRPGQVVVGLLNPAGSPQAIRELAAKRVTAFALELLPRIARAQPMDSLTSMASITGYRAAILGASLLPKVYPMMITAAGTITPARVLVIGAGVAGLEAIATSRRLGAVVHAYDVRPAVKEQVESLGAKFLELPLESSQAEATSGYARAMGEEFYHRQQEMLAQAVGESDVVISTAAVPGKRAPILVTAAAVGRMRSGSVIIDLAAETGGNCELTRSGETVEVNGVSILGPRNLPSEVPYHASQMVARNFSAFLQNLVKQGELQLNLEDSIIRDTLVTHEGEVVNPRVRELLGLPASPSAPQAERS
ncbi:MAG: Re/Si-specific NAD(P)(+) transhydrogenase subunit alpha [Terriglobia bacterium]